MEPIDFTFADGGAVIKLLRRHGLFREFHPSLSERIRAIMAITWIPVLIFTAIDGLAVGNKVRVPYLMDFVQYARFLLALPIAVWSEGFISERLVKVLNRFVDGRIISGTEIPRFTSAVSRTRRLKDSVPAELLILGLAFFYVVLGLQRDLPPNLTTWTASAGAAFWYHWISMPIFFFIWIRWVWRLGIWAYLFFKIAGLKLNLRATHPDRAGGMTFVSTGQRRFAALVFAISAVGSASIGEEMLFTGASLRTFEPEIATFFVLSVIAVMGPLLVFTPRLIHTKLTDWRHYGLLSADYTNQFHDRWIVENPLFSRKDLLGTQDIQALADLQNSYEVVSAMRTILIDRASIIVLLIAYSLPLMPLLLTVIPLKEILSTILKLLS